LYLAVVIDWAPDTDLTGKALSMAYEVRGPLKVSCFIQIKAVIIQVNNFVDYFGGIDVSVIGS
jgi:hypothetical protein